jgi:hypothetical protein
LVGAKPVAELNPVAALLRLLVAAEDPPPVMLFTGLPAFEEEPERVCEATMKLAELGTEPNVVGAADDNGNDEKLGVNVFKGPEELNVGRVTDGNGNRLWVPVFKDPDALRLEPDVADVKDGNDKKLGVPVFTEDGQSC